MNSTHAIGVFDSGLGGLSVLRELKAALPFENFLYLGDVARLPYGTKSSAVVTRYAENCLEFLKKNQVKIAVVACNTATAMALPKLQEADGLKVFGVIEPGVRAALKETRNKKVLVLATSSTVRSEAYVKEFAKQDSSVTVEQVACPLLVPLAEEGWFDKQATEEIIQHYLAQAKDQTYDTVLLGCTHYPLLDQAFRKILPSTISLVHGGKELGREIQLHLSERGLAQTHPAVGKIDFYATDEIPRSLPILRTLFDTEVVFSTIDL